MLFHFNTRYLDYKTLSEPELFHPMRHMIINYEKI